MLSVEGARRLSRGPGVSASSPSGVWGSAPEGNAYFQHNRNFFETLSHCLVKLYMNIFDTCSVSPYVLIFMFDSNSSVNKSQNIWTLHSQAVIV